MNERIKELSEQCHWETYGVNGELLESGFDEEKFAELIIQECADVCQGFGESGDGYTCSYEILEHFGVES